MSTVKINDENHGNDNEKGGIQAREYNSTNFNNENDEEGKNTSSKNDKNHSLSSIMIIYRLHIIWLKIGYLVNSIK